MQMLRYSAAPREDGAVVPIECADRDVAAEPSRHGASLQGDGSANIVSLWAGTYAIRTSYFAGAATRAGVATPLITSSSL